MVELLRGRSERPRVVKGTAGELVDYGAGAVYPLLPEMTDLEIKRQHMDEGGIGKAVLSLNIPGLDWFDGADAPSIARDVNDQLVDAVASHPDRFAAFSALPMQVPEAAVDELHRSLDRGACGAMLYSNVAGRSLDEPEYRQVFDAAAERDVPIMLHPTYPLSAPSLQAHALLPVIGFLFDTTTATLRLVLDGLFVRHPDFKLILGHAGSVLPYIIGRVDYESGRIPGGLGALEDAVPSDHIRRLYVDTVSAWPLALDLVIKFLGADRVLFATDHPFWDPQKTFDALSEVELDRDDRDAVEWRNASALLGID